MGFITNLDEVEDYDGRPLQIPTRDNAPADTRKDQAFIVRFLNSSSLSLRRGSANDAVRPAGDVRGLRASQRLVVVQARSAVDPETPPNPTALTVLLTSLLADGELIGGEAKTDGIQAALGPHDLHHPPALTTSD